MAVCTYCKWKILDDDNAIVEVDEEIYHDPCYTYNNWLSMYFELMEKEKEDKEK